MSDSGLTYKDQSAAKAGSEIQLLENRIIKNCELIAIINHNPNIELSICERQAKEFELNHKISVDTTRMNELTDKFLKYK